MPETLVEAQWLRERLGDPGVRVAEIQYEPNVDEYADGHVPGALHWYWKDAFWDPYVREFIEPSQMAALLGEGGVSADGTLVLYSGRVQYAIYGAWVVGAMCGHRDVRVLNGGRRAWVAAGGSLETARPAAAPVEYGAVRAARDDTSRVVRRDVMEFLGRADVRLLDARYDEEYRGERVKPGTGVDHGAERHGRIPGAVSLPFHRLRSEDFRLRPAPELESAFRAAGAAPDQCAEAIAYCRLGHRGSLLWFAATQLLGWDHVRVYDGSWTEWGSTVGSPIER